MRISLILEDGALAPAAALGRAWRGLWVRPRAPRPGVTLAWAVGIVAIDMALSLAMTLLVGDATLGDRILTDGAGYALRLAVALLILRRLAGPERSVRDLIWFDAGRWRRDLRWGLGAVAVGSVLVTALLGAIVGAVLLFGGRLPGPTPADAALLGRDGLLGNAALLAGVAFIGFLAAPVMEEVVYRGVLAPPLLARTSPAAAALLGGLLFGFLHVLPYQHGGFGEMEILGGLLMTLGFWMRRSLLVAMLLHAAGNAYLAAVAAGVVLAAEEWPALFHAAG